MVGFRRQVRGACICLFTAGLLSSSGAAADNVVAQAKLAKVDNTAGVVAVADDPTLGEKVGKLMARKEKAVMAEDYLLADRLKREIEGISKKDSTNPNPTGFFTAFVSSISMIIVSEIGDKTFFIAAIMAMRNSRAEVPNDPLRICALLSAARKSQTPHGL